MPRVRKLDVQLYTESIGPAYCGPYAVSALLSAHRVKQSPQELVAMVGFLEGGGWNSEDTVAALRKSGVRYGSKYIPRDFQDWTSLPYPILIAVWDIIDTPSEGHYVTMYEVDQRGRAILADSSARGIRFLPLKKLMEGWFHSRNPKEDRGRYLFIKSVKRGT